MSRWTRVVSGLEVCLGLVACLAAVALGAPACGARTVGGRAIAERRPLRVGSKAFTESVILGEVAALIVAAAGAPVEHRAALGGTRLCWNALVAGELDTYPEYTGTLAHEILGGAREQAPADLAALREELRAQGVGILGPLGFDNTYALGVSNALAARLGVRTISDLTRHPGLRFGFSNEFMSRRDGWPGLAKRYLLRETAAEGLDHDLAYRGLSAGDIDVTDLYVTDAEIRRYDLRVLVDDLGFFPKYEAVFLYRLDAQARRPAAFAALGRLAGRIDAASMTAMNARAKLDHVPEGRIAADFVAAHLDGPPSEGVGRGEDGAPPHVQARIRERIREILRRTREHLALVAVSLLAAILVALPLGIVAARRARIGQVVLAAVGLVQTIPSLALLVFMIPLLGIGTTPAIAALFLYSLLPIVRNTHAGLRSIPPTIHDAAEAMGLPPRAILWRVELPLALGTILAGVKSAAVINVGTATLGALVGAGGFGQPIFTGIRLDDVPLILQGAVPASLLALAVQGTFDLVERVLVPRSLRPGRGAARPGHES